METHERPEFILFLVTLTLFGGHRDPGRARVLVGAGCYLSGRWPLTFLSSIYERYGAPMQPEGITIEPEEIGAMVIPLPYVSNYVAYKSLTLTLGDPSPLCL